MPCQQRVLIAENLTGKSQQLININMYSPGIINWILYSSVKTDTCLQNSYSRKAAYALEYSVFSSILSNLH